MKVRLYVSFQDSRSVESKMWLPSKHNSSCRAVISLIWKHIVLLKTVSLKKIWVRFELRKCNKKELHQKFQVSNMIKTTSWKVSIMTDFMKIKIQINVPTWYLLKCILSKTIGQTQERKHPLWSSSIHPFKVNSQNFYVPQIFIDI